MPSAPSHEEATCPACKRPHKGPVDTPPAGRASSALWDGGPALLQGPAVPKEEGHTDPVTVPVPLGTLEEMHCEEHGEKVCFFCGHDAQLLCMRCREGPSHHTHAVGFLDGACQPNQVRSMALPWAFGGGTVSGHT